MRHWCMFIILAVSCGFVDAYPIPSNQIFTYQGRLYDNGTPLDGTVDLILHLRDGSDPNTAEIVAVQSIANHPISNGYMTLEINFEQDPVLGQPEMFDGSDRWLEFWMRDGVLEDPNDYHELYPLVKLEAAPFAHAAHRLKTPAALRGETIEPTLTVGNEGQGAAVYFEDADAVIEYYYNASTNVVNDLTLHVGNSQFVTIDRDSTVQISSNRALNVGSNETKMVGFDSDTTVGSNRTMNIGGNSTTIAEMNIQIEAGNALSLSSQNPVELQDGVFVSKDSNDLLKVDGAVTMKAMSSGTPATAVYGKLFVNNADGKLYYIDTAGMLHNLTAVAADRVNFSVKRDASYAWSSSSSFETVDFSSDTAIWDNTGGGFTTKTVRLLPRTMGSIRSTGPYCLPAWPRVI